MNNSHWEEQLHLSVSLCLIRAFYSPTEMRVDIWREFWMWFQDRRGGIIEERALPSSNNGIIYVEHLLNSVPPHGFIIKHQFNLHLSVWKSPRPLVVSSPSIPLLCSFRLSSLRCWITIMAPCDDDVLSSSMEMQHITVHIMRAECITCHLFESGAFIMS